MKPEISPLRCVDAFVADISVKANLSFDSKKEITLSYQKLEIDSVVLPQAEEGAPHQVTLTVSQDASAMGNVPYSFSIEIVGFFEAKGVEEKELERFIYIHGSSVLYGMARGALNDTMAKGPFVTVALPLVSFYKAKKVAAKKTVTKKKPPRKQRKGLPGK